MSGSGLFTKKQGVIPHLAAGHGVSKEVEDLRSDVAAELLPLAAITVEEWTNPAGASPNAILLAKASTVATQAYTAAQLDGAVGAAAMSPPRNITVTTAGVTPSDAPATLTVTGVDIHGTVMTESISVPQTATIAVGAKAFAKVTGLALTAGDGTAATVAVGFGSKIGLSKKIKSRAGGAVALREIAVGSLVTNGTMAAATVGVPNGTYLPNTIPDGANDYCVFFEFDPNA